MFDIDPNIAPGSIAQIVLLRVDANDATVAKEAGADFIYKSVSPEELIATLTPLLRKE